MNVRATKPTKRHPQEEVFNEFFIHTHFFAPLIYWLLRQHKSFLYGTCGWIGFLTFAAVHQTENIRLQGSLKWESDLPPQCVAGNLEVQS